MNRGQFSSNPSRHLKMFSTVPPNASRGAGFLSIALRWMAPSLAMLLVSTGFGAGAMLDEPFGYADGPLAAVSGDLWQTHSGTADQLQVVSGEAALDQNQTEDLNTLLPGQPYLASAGVVLYAGFTVRFTQLPSSSGAYFAHLKGSGSTTFRAKIFALTSGAGENQFRVGIANVANAPDAIAATNLNLNKNYSIVIRYDVGNATASLWVNSDSEGSPSVTATDVATPADIVSFALRENSGEGVLFLDNLKVGTSFAEVYTSPPLVPPTIMQSPQNAAAVKGGSASFTVRASGSDPLEYQWKFNGQELLGRTNATLTLTNVDSTAGGQYDVSVSNPVGSTNGGPALLTVIQPAAGGTLTLMTYNVMGNFAADWTTNALQIQAIGREVAYLSPDIITFNEIPNSRTYEMTNFVNLYLPGYFMATNSGTDGSIRSVIVSRYPIGHSQKWLDGSSLTNFGYDGNFTRDLFEAEILLPDATEPLHVFTTHLKSGSDSASQDRRAAEASAVSNFFVNVFLPTNGNRPYVLTGDLNEDIDNPPSSATREPIQRLVSDPTGLHLTTPLNPISLSPLTHSIQSANGLDKRYDYILPSGLLLSNIVSSEVFRTDLLDPVPAGLLAGDDATASDHLPVLMVFNYPDPALRVSVVMTNQMVLLKWPALVGRTFEIQTSSDLSDWSVAQSNVTAVAGEQTWTTPVGSGEKFYRVVRAP